jgi:predicted deacylase
MNSHDVLASISAIVDARDDLVMSRSPLARVASRVAEGPLVIIQAGLHGDERAGPVTVARHLDRIATFIHRRGMQLAVFPLANPRGYDAGTRYDGERPSHGNNDFLRYDRDDDVTSAWRWSDGGGPETRALRDMLRALPLDRVVAAIDLHQDCITPNVGAASYAYAFPPLAVYAPIVTRVRSMVPIMAHANIDAGYEGDPQPSDANGLLVRHDGSFSDLMFRLGAKHSIAVETTGATPLDVACEVNLAWIEGVVELCG